MARCSLRIGIKEGPWWLACVTAIFCLTGCSSRNQQLEEYETGWNTALEQFKQSPTLEFVIPDRYSGPLKLVLDPEHGADISAASNRIEIVFPISGVLHVRDFGPLNKWHVLTARTSSGQVLDVDPDPAASSGNAPSVWSVGTIEGTKYPRKTLVYLVCTPAELEPLRRSL